MLGALFGDTGRRAGDLGSLGDVVCTNAEVSAAGDAVRQMQSVYASLGSPQKWQSTVQAISDSWDFYSTPVADLWRDFWQCERKNIGQKAQQVTQSMQADAGQLPVPSSPPLAPSQVDKVIGAIASATAVYGIVEIVKLLRAA